VRDKGGSSPADHLVDVGVQSDAWHDYRLRDYQLIASVLVFPSQGVPQRLTARKTLFSPFQ
jgi:hypothetical protein